LLEPDAVKVARPVLRGAERSNALGLPGLSGALGGGLTNVGDASVYGTLQRLYESGFLSSYLVHSKSGPQRRYYGLRSEGRVELKSGCREAAPYASNAWSGAERESVRLPRCARCSAW
jgi:PadR family transcriptional regulator PadR